MNTDLKITIERNPHDKDLQVLFKGIHDYNTGNSGASEAELLSIFLRDRKQEIQGGVYGWTAYGWLRIDILWVAEKFRGMGLGKRLLLAAEAEGLKRGCRYATLDTFSFQAPALYKKFGYSEFAILADVAGKHTWHFFKKDLNFET